MCIIMKKIGLIVNPIAGMGGSVGLKGTDDVYEEAVKRGAIAKAADKCTLALSELLCVKDKFELITASGYMGEYEAINASLECKIIYSLLNKHQTTNKDTINCAIAMVNENIDILVFVGGDGTARDIFKAVGEKTPCIGIPAGVKIHSPVYAQTPKKAGILLKQFIVSGVLGFLEKEVIDIDEQEYRKGNVNTKLFGYLNVPFEKRLLQNKKSPSPLSEKASQYAIADDVIANMEDNIYYIIGPGSTTRTIMECLNLNNTLIGVDIIYNKKLVKNDLTEKEILSIIKDKATRLIVTPTGGQGFLLGRGNQQISYRVISQIGRENIIIIATKEKIAGMNSEPLLVDTGDDKTNRLMEGYYQIVTGYKERVVYKVIS